MYKVILLVLFIGSSAGGNAEILKMPYDFSYKWGYAGDFSSVNNVASEFREYDLGIEKIYGFQAVMKLRDDSLFSGTSHLGLSIHDNYLLNGSAYSGINLNSYSPRYMRYSYYGEIFGRSRDGSMATFFEVFLSPEKNTFSRFGFDEAYILYSTEPSDIFLTDTRNAIDTRYSTVSDDKSVYLFLLVFLSLLAIVEKRDKFISLYK